jgi:DNA-binding NarL/FixJ family response regulator
MIKVLVVDDHPVFRQGLFSLLKDCQDFQVVGEAANGTEAISKASEHKPDVVVMDVRMPECNGVQATAALQEATPDSKVLVLTVSDRDDDLFAAMKAGAKGYLLKDAELDSLITAIKVVASGDVIITPAMAARLINEVKQGNMHQGNEKMNGLSVRERQVMQLVVQGDSNKDIAAKLFISETTVKAHLRTILEKLQVKNRAQAAALVTAKGLSNKTQVFQVSG